jgi:hypothetical protein
VAFLKTLLGAVALCAALLIWADGAIGLERSGLEPASGLTVAAVLAGDGMTPDGSLGDSHLDRAALDRLARTASDEPRRQVRPRSPPADGRIPVAGRRRHSVIPKAARRVRDPDRPPLLLCLDPLDQARYLPLRFTSTRVPTGTRS